MNMPNIAIVTNNNGIGLTRDAELLTAFLEERGHSVTVFQYDGEVPEQAFGLVIFLEVIPRNMLELAPVRWAFLNPEFATPIIVKTAQRHIHKVFAKTHEAKRIFDEVFPGKAHYTGFLTRDQFEPGTERKPWFLNIGGNSSIRGTQAVLDAWKWKKDGQRIAAQLFIISSVLQERSDLPNVHIWDRVSEVQLKLIQNQCAFHLFPSGTEGFGHAFHEAQSVGAFILTTDAPPMNELERAYKIPVVGRSKYNLADVYEVSALDIFKGVHDLLDLYGLDGFGDAQSILVRGKFMIANDEFKGAFSAHLEQFNPRPTAPAIRVKGAGLQIAFIGNFKAEHSTENQIKWALEEGLGHDVEMLQENEVNLAAIRSAVEFSDLLFWVRTPGWLRVSDREMLELIENAKIPTVSVHLDKFFCIPDREALIGTHPFFKTKFVFTADGSRQKDFKARGVNHFFMPPAASAVYSHPGTPWDMYRCDVGFVGARSGYHAEHPFRAQLIDFLEKTYGDRFKLIEGLRGHGLNDFYQSCKVCVADCFGGGKIPRYWSDRMVETPMRHGFLLSPEIEGMTIPLATFEPENLTDLHEQIEYWLAHGDERKSLRSLCADHVAKHDTWTIRMASIIETVQNGLGRAIHA